MIIIMIYDSFSGYVNIDLEWYQIRVSLFLLKRFNLALVYAYEELHVWYP